MKIIEINEILIRNEYNSRFFYTASKEEDIKIFEAVNI